MKILIFNKREFNEFMTYNGITDDNVESKDMLIISINNPKNSLMFSFKSDVISFFKRNHSNVLIEHFPDYEENMSLHFISKGDFSIFNEHKAKRIYEFIKNNKHKKMAVIHCAAGISRSGAIGTFIFDLYGKDSMIYEEFKRKNPRIMPNDYILKLLRREYYKDNHIALDSSEYFS